MPDEQEPKGMWNKLWLERTRVLLPLSILISPFLNFLDHHSYDLGSVEVVLGLSAIVMVALLFSFMTMVGGRLFRDFVIIGLIMFFVDIQFDLMDEIGKFSKIGIAIGLFTLARLIGDNFHRIATTIFVAVLVVTLVQLPLSKGVTKSRKVWKTPSGSNNPPPRLIHLILDEHIGVEGIPTEMAEGRTLKESLSRFYQRNGFRLFGGAFSRYADTLNSISNTLNFSAENKSLAFVVERENSLSVSRNSLSQNNYFESLAREGYHINVVSSSHLDLCANSTVNLDNCSRYEFGVKSIETMGSPTFRFQLICLSYLNRSYGFRRLRTLVPLPWIQHPHHLSSIQSMNLLDGLWEDILALPRGNVLFVHLMFPHGPFAVRTDCSIKPFGQWKGGRLENPPPYNTAGSRKESYQHYFHQLECLYVKLESLFERMRDAGIYDDSIIVLQGDHGSRIVMTYPIPKYRGSLKEQDLMDAYSALFAVKGPGIHGGYDSSPRPLEALLAQFVSEHVASSSLDFTLEQSAFVYLGSDPDLKGKRKGKELMPIPYLIAHH